MIRYTGNAIRCLLKDPFDGDPDVSGRHGMEQVQVTSIVVCGMLAMVLSLTDAKADEYVSYAFGKAYKVRVSGEMIQRAPQWLEKDDNPPVSPRKALRIAEGLANKLIGDRAGYRREPQRDGLCLKPTEGG